jgi:hypothetical protein
MTSRYGSQAVHAELAGLYAPIRTHTPTRRGTIHACMHARTHARKQTNK